MGKGSPHHFSHPRISHPRHPHIRQRGVRPLSSGIWPPARSPVIGWSHFCPHRTRARTLSPQAKQIHGRQAGGRAGGGGQVPRPREHRGQRAGLPLREVTLGSPKPTSAWLPLMGGLWGPGGHTALLTAPSNPSPPRRHRNSWASGGWSHRTTSPPGPALSWRSNSGGDGFSWGQAGLLKIHKRRLKNLVTH